MLSSFYDIIIERRIMGHHFYHFYEDDEKLAEVLAKFFGEGFRKLEYCVWITRADITYDKAVKLLKKHLPDIEDFIIEDQMFIESFDAWGLREDGTFDKNHLLNKWMGKYDEVIKKGFMTMRAAGDPSSVLKTHWDEFMTFESKLNDAINDLSIIAVCTYRGKIFKPSKIHTILKSHFCPLAPAA
jgi:hypothetical protein